MAKADLAAQRWMAVFAGLQVLLTFGGLIYIRWTLKETRKAVREAAAGTDAAQSAVQVTRETAAHQLRAYVGARGINYHYRPTDQQFSVGAEIVNFGQTPAYRFNLRAGLNTINLPLGPPPDIGPIAVESGETLYPTMTTNTALSVAVPPWVVSEINAGQKTLLFTLRVSYIDHTGTAQSDEIRWYFNLGMNGGPLLGERDGVLSTWPGPSV